MGFFSDAYNRYSPLAAALRGDWLGAVERITPLTYLKDATGYTQYQNAQDSARAQQDYENYLKAGNERALADWNKNVGSKGRTIKYPELSYAGQIYRSSTAYARAGYDADSAGANYYGNLPYRSAGLFGIAGKFSRYL